MANNTLASNISQAINDFAAIKQAINEKGVDIPDRTPTSQYDQLIRSIRTNGTIQINRLSTNTPAVWQLHDMPDNLQGIAYGRVDNRFFLIAGAAAAGGIHIFDLATRTWSQGAPVPYVTGYLYSASGVVYGKYIYVIGGYDGAQYFDYLYRYDMESDTWEQKAACPVNTIYAAAGLVDHKIIIAGGITDNNIIATTYLYDIDTDTWTPGADMPTAQSYTANSGTVYNRKLYVAGGASPGFIAQDTLYCYDLDTNTWTTKAPMSITRSGVALVTSGNKIYAMGGRRTEASTGQDQYLNIIEAYDPYTNQWVTSGYLSYNSFRGMPCAYQGDLYLFGGSDEGTVHNFIQHWKAAVPIRKISLDGQYTARFDKNIYYNGQLIAPGTELQMLNGLILFPENKVSGYIQSVEENIDIENLI